MPRLNRLVPTLLVLLPSAGTISAQAPPTLPDSGALVRIHTNAAVERGRLLAPFRPDAATIRYCAYPGPACDANTPVDRLLEMRTDAIRSLERSVGTHWREGAVIGGLIGAGIGVVGLALADASDEQVSGSSTGRYVRFAALSGVFFGALGAMLSSSSQRWEAVF